MLSKILIASLVLLFTQLPALQSWNFALERLSLSQLSTVNPTYSTVILSGAMGARNLEVCHLMVVSECLSWLSLKNERSIREVYSPMKIKFRQSGGYAGLRMSCEINTASLPSEEATQLISLVENSRIFQATSQRTPNAADLLTYEFTIETKAGTHQVSFDDLSLPESIRPLLEYLQSQTKPLR